MCEAVQSHFDSRASDYDGNRHFLIPNFEEYYSIGVDTLLCPKAEPRVLDLGGGTGLSSMSLLKKYPNARLTLLDISEEMLGVAKERFKDLPNVDYLVGDYRSFLPDERFDIVVSGLSIHHLSFEEKQDLAYRVFKILEPQGEFVNSDLARCENAVHEQEMHRRLDGFIHGHLGEEALIAFNTSQKIDIPVTVNEQLEFLRNAGFRIVDCLYRYWIYGVFYGRK